MKTQTHSKARSLKVSEILWAWAKLEGEAPEDASMPFQVMWSTLTSKHGEAAVEAALGTYDNEAWLRSGMEAAVQCN